MSLCVRSAKALFRKAQALEGLQQFQPALDALQQALKEQPKDPQVCHSNDCTAYTDLQVTAAAHTDTVPNDLVHWYLSQIHAAVARIQARLPVCEAQPGISSQQPNRYSAVKPLTAVELTAQAPSKLPLGSIYQPSADGINENLLILLHGYGDTPGS